MGIANTSYILVSLLSSSSPLSFPSAFLFNSFHLYRTSMANCFQSFLSHARGFTITLQVINIIVCTCAGCFSTYLFYLLIKAGSFGFSSLQSYIALVYLIALCVFITGVELRTLRHRHLIVLLYFLFFPVGRGFAMIFIGAVLLGALVWGWVVGAVLIAVGLLNTFLALCHSKDEPQEVREAEQPSTPQ